MNIDEAIGFLQRIRGTGAHKGEQVLSVILHKPGNVGGTPTVPVKAMYSGFDWYDGKLLIELERDVTDLTAEQVAEISESARKGQSWHSYQQYKKLRADLAAAQRELAAWRKAVYEAVCDDVAATGELTPSVYGKGWLTCAEFINRRVAELLAQEGGK